ncbi:MAG: hypothetical protein ACRDIY_01385 [Chloroflexota bacterium]
MGVPVGVGVPVRAMVGVGVAEAGSAGVRVGVEVSVAETAVCAAVFGNPVGVDDADWDGFSLDGGGDAAGTAGWPTRLDSIAATTTTHPKTTN